MSTPLEPVRNWPWLVLYAVLLLSVGGPLVVNGHHPHWLQATPVSALALVLAARWAWRHHHRSPVEGADHQAP